MRRPRSLAFALLVALLAVPVVAMAQASDRTLSNIPLPGSPTTPGHRVHSDGTTVDVTIGVGALKIVGVTFANLSTVDLGPGTIVYCTDCTKATPCAGSSTGAWAKRRGGSVAWDCD